MRILKKTLQHFKSTPKIKCAYITMLVMLLFLTSCRTTTNGGNISNPSSTNKYETIASSTSYEEDITEENIVTSESETSSTSEETLSTLESAEPPEITSEEPSELQVHFIDVGQGDSTLIICDSEAMLIDAGDNDQGTKVQNYLQKQGVESLKYVICTHPDSDHIGGMDVILYKFDCETIFMTDGEKDTNTYRDVIDAMKSKTYKSTLPIVGNSYSLGDAEFTIVAPSQLGNDSNNNSIAIILTHGDNKFIFTGDAESDEESDILNSGISIDADVYKVGHHGSSSSYSVEFLNAVSPTYAVISCAEGNSYGHPHAETLNNFRSMGVQVFRTDEQGSIVATSDGTNITWNCSPSDIWQAGENTQNSGSNSNDTNNTSETTSASNITKESTVIDEVKTPNTITYICNTNTKKFHYPSCSSVKQMSEKNKKTVTTTRDELINQGYDSCKRCNP